MSALCIIASLIAYGAANGKLFDHDEALRESNAKVQGLSKQINRLEAELRNKLASLLPEQLNNRPQFKAYIKTT